MIKSIQFNVINASVVRLFDLWLPQEFAHLPSGLIRLCDQRHTYCLFIYSLNLLNLFLQSNCFYVNPPSTSKQPCALRRWLLRPVRYCARSSNRCCTIQMFRGRAGFWLVRPFLKVEADLIGGLLGALSRLCLGLCYLLDPRLSTAMLFLDDPS